MIKKLFYLLPSVLIITYFYSCSKSENDITNPSFGINLLKNSSFEKYGLPTTTDWILSVTDTTFLRYLLRFSTDVPPGGGKSSIIINYGFPGPWRMYQLVPATGGTDVYRVSFWARNYFGQGKVILGLKTLMDTVFEIHTMRAKDSSWTYYSFSDTITTNIGDSLIVILNSGYLGVTRIDGGTWFDVVRMDRLY